MGFAFLGFCSTAFKWCWLASLIPRPPREKNGGLVYVVTCASAMNFIPYLRGFTGCVISACPHARTYAHNRVDSRGSSGMLREFAMKHGLICC